MSDELISLDAPIPLCAWCGKAPVDGLIMRAVIEETDATPTVVELAWCPKCSAEDPVVPHAVALYEIEREPERVTLDRLFHVHDRGEGRVVYLTGGFDATDRPSA